MEYEPTWEEKRIAELKEELDTLYGSLFWVKIERYMKEKNIPTHLIEEIKKMWAEESPIEKTEMILKNIYAKLMTLWEKSDENREHWELLSYFVFAWNFTCYPKNCL
jgi:hypothetical protein